MTRGEKNALKHWVEQLERISMAPETSDNFAERLLRSAQQAVAVKRGEAKPARVTRRKVTARKVVVEKAPRYAPARRGHIAHREEKGTDQQSR